MARFDNFESILRKFLLQIGCHVSQDNRAIYDAMNNLRSEKKRGIWRFVAAALGVDEKDVHNYYHGKWVMQFFADARGYRQELREMTRQACANTKDVSTQDIVKRFEVAHPDLSFFPRQVQQIVGVYKSRLQRKGPLAAAEDSQCDSDRHEVIQGTSSADSMEADPKDEIKKENFSHMFLDTVFVPYMDLITFDGLFE